jgi:hypothetical protein
VNLHIARLSLRVANLAEADGRRLAQLVGNRLAGATLSAPVKTTDAMRVAINAQPDEGLESLAQRIVAEMLNGLVQTR